MKLKKNELLKLLYIEAHLLIKDEIGRPALVARFSISKETATRSFAIYEGLCPEQMYIDKGLRKPAYRASTGCKPCLFNDQEEARLFLETNNMIDTIVDRKLTELNIDKSC